MNGDDQPRLSVLAGFFLLIVGALTDGVQFIAELLLIGFIIDPIISVVASIIFWVVLQHNDIPMFSGKRAWAGWVTTLAEIMPGIDGFLPGWTAFAIFLIVSDRVSRFYGV